MEHSEGQDVAEKYNFHEFFECSSKTGENIDRIFDTIARAMLKKVTLKIYTVSGKLIRSFEGYHMAFADYHEIIWDGKDDWGEEVANGVYFFQLKAEYEQGVKDMRGTCAKIQ